MATVWTCAWINRLLNLNSTFSRIIHGDSIEITKTLPQASIHAIISDIPYGIGLEDWDILHENTNSAFCGSSCAQERAGPIFRRRGKPLNGWCGADRNIPAQYQAWCASWAGSWLRVLKPGASCFIFAGRQLAHRCVCALEEAGFTFREQLAWVKCRAPQRAQRLASIYKRRGDTANALVWAGWRVANPRPVFEPILWFQKPYKIGGTIADNVLSEGVGAWNETALRKYTCLSENSLSNVIRVKSSSGDSGLHSAQKPLELMELLVSLVTLERQIILDPFMGSGTTCVAAKKLNRQYIGIDVDIANVRITEKRLLAAEAQGPWEVQER